MMTSTLDRDTGSLTVSAQFHFERRGKGARKAFVHGAAVPQPQGRVPRVSRLMALALRFLELLAEDVVPDYAALARLGHVTRARMTQIMNLTLLAPDIQEDLLFLPLVVEGRDPIILRDLQPIAQECDWRWQRKLWANLQARTKTSPTE